MSDLARAPIAQNARQIQNPAASGLLQRQCTCGNHTVAGGECAECSKKREINLQRSACSDQPVNGVPSFVHDVLRSSGQPLDAETRAFFEPRFGRDFSGVRVHIDEQAAESARAVHANAYTVGNHIAFGVGRFAPTTGAGQRLLAHELTHVVQQERGGTTPGAVHEVEAQRVAHNVVASNAQFGIRQSSGIGIAREPTEQPADGPARGLGNIVLDTAIRTVVSQLPGGGLPSRMMASAMYGFGSETISQLKGDAQSGSLKAAFAELAIPSNAAGFASSYVAGAAAGLISPVTDLLGLGALAEQMPLIAANLAKNVWEKSSELSAEAHAIGAAFSNLYHQAKSKFAELRGKPSEIFAMLDSMRERAVAAAASAGSNAAKTAIAYFKGKDEEPKDGKAAAPQESVKDTLLRTQPEERTGVLSFLTSKATRLRKAVFTTPWQKIGYNVGYAVGAIVVNVLLLAATEGIGNLIVEVSAGLGKLAPLLSGVEKALVGLGGRIAEIEKAIASCISVVLKPLSGATKWAEPLLKPLGEMMERLSGFVRKLLGLSEKAVVAKSAGAATKAVSNVAESIEAKVVPTRPNMLAPEPRVVAPPAAKPTPGVTGQANIGKQGLKTDSGTKLADVVAEAPKATPEASPAFADSPPAAKATVVADRPPHDAVAFVKDNPNVIKGEPGRRHASVGEGHEIVEIPDGSLPSGIGCELHSSPPFAKVPCPPGMGSKGKETIEQFKQRGGEVKTLEPGKTPELSPSEVTAVSEPKPPKGFEDLDVPSRTEKQAGVRVAEDHHVATLYRKENKKLFEKIGFDMDDDFNLIKDFKEHGELRGWQKWDPEKKVYIPQQKGHHPEYNEWVTEKVKSSIKGLRGKKRQVAFQSAVEEIASIVEKHPDVLAYGPEIFARSNILK